MYSMERYDIVIFGATGFTGKEVVLKLLNVIEDHSPLTWAIAARSGDKMRMLVRDIKNEKGVDLSTIPQIEANINDYSSLLNMTKYAKVLVNCVGPYTKFGEVVVKACIETKTHCLDITAEINYIDVIAERLHKAAEEADVLIIPACGFGSAPGDMGVALLQKSFEGKLKLVKSYNQFFFPKMALVPGVHCLLHYGTWESLIHVLADYHKSKDKYNSTLLTDQDKGSFFQISNYKLWVPYPGPDEYVIERSQLHLSKTKQIDPVPCSGINCTRNLLLKYPRLFTFGYFSHKGPTEYIRNNTSFRFDMIAYGCNIGDDKQRTLKVVVKGKDPGYGVTSMCFILCALTLVKEYYRMPRGGVVSTAAAFYDTSLIDKLNKNGITYELS